MNRCTWRFGWRGRLSGDASRLGSDVGALTSFSGTSTHVAGQSLEKYARPGTYAWYTTLSILLVNTNAEYNLRTASCDDAKFVAALLAGTLENCTAVNRAATCANNQRDIAPFCIHHTDIRISVFIHHMRSGSKFRIKSRYKPTIPAPIFTTSARDTRDLPTPTKADTNTDSLQTTSPSI